MDIRNVNKIILVSLCDSFSKEIGTQLSQNLGMIFCDTNDLIEYELIDKKAIEEMCTTAYLERSEKKVLRHISSFENVVVSISYDYLIHNINILKEKSLIVFLKLSKNYVKENGNSVDVIDFETRSAELEENSSISIPVKKTETEFVCNKILSELGGLL